MKRTILKFGDRIRIFSGIRRVSIEAILPIIILPISFGIAAINFYFLMLICISMPLLLGLAQWHRKMLAPRTKFFFMWTLSSGIYLWCLFEMTVPVMELLPEENFIFITALFGAAICFYKVSNKYSRERKKIPEKKTKKKKYCVSYVGMNIFINSLGKRNESENIELCHDSVTFGIFSHRHDKKHPTIT